MIDAEKYLEEIARDNTNIENKLAEINQLKILATNISAAISANPVQSSGSSDRIGKIVSDIVDKENELKKLVDTLVDKRNARIKIIEQLEDKLEYQVLHKFYIQNKSIANIALEEHYSYQWIKQIKKRALKNFSAILNNIPKNTEV